MTEEQLDQILKKGEGLLSEFKEAQGGVPRTMYESVVAFSNLDGGTVVLGVDDDGRVLGLDENKVSRYQQDISNQLHNPDCIQPPIHATPRVVNHSNGNLIILQLPASTQVHTYRNKVFIRSHEGDMDVTHDQEHVRQIHLRKSNFFSEGKIYESLRIDDLDSELFLKARSLIRGYQSTHPWLSLSDEELLRSASLWKRDFQTNKEGLTLAAALIFGKDETIQGILPAYKLDALLRRDNTDRYDDRIVFRTNLIDTYLGLIDFIKKHLPEKFFTEDGQRKDLRDLIFREVIGNVLVHREYPSSYATEFVIQKDRVIATNPTKPHFHGAIDPTQFSPYPKNPNIRKFFTAFGWTDELGSGIRNTNKYVPFYVPHAKPSFIEGDIFKTEIPLVSAILSVYVDSFIAWLEFPDESRSHLVQGFASIMLDPSLAGENWTKVFSRLVPSWNEKGAKLEKLNWVDYQELTNSESEEVPSSGEKGTKSVPKKFSYLIKILCFTSSPIQLEQLMTWIDYKNKATFRKNYFKPLMESGLITMTNPDNPKASNQQYTLTPSGRSFLGGLR